VLPRSINKTNTVTTLKPIDLTCPNCEWTFFSDAAVSSNGQRRKRTDFHVTSNGVGVPSITYGVHLCDSCGFAGPESWFNGEGHVSEDLRRRVWDELAPHIARGPLPPSEKYEFAAKVATWVGVSPRQVGDLWLRAAWCSVDEGDIEAERFYRIRAARCFEEALGIYQGLDLDERAVITYLIGELWRRIGDSRRAAAFFGMVPYEVTDAQSQGWLVRWAKQQQDDPREWFG
jgi:uncharacterized protein (DUF2225 family)